MIKTHFIDKLPAVLNGRMGTRVKPFIEHWHQMYEKHANRLTYNAYQLIQRLFDPIPIRRAQKLTLKLRSVYSVSNLCIVNNVCTIVCHWIAGSIAYFCQ